MNETILCAAVWYDDKKPHPHQPTETGLVRCGYRHCAIHPQTQMLLKDRKALGIVETSGFLTSKGRFVGRPEAAEIAFRAGQIKKQKDYLCSEDVY